MCRSRRGTMKRNEARERSTTRRFEPWVDTCLGSSTKCSPKNATMRYALKRGIPKPRSVRDRSLKRKYGGRKSQSKKRNNKSTNRARKRRLSPLEISSGMFRLSNLANLDNFVSLLLLGIVWRVVQG